MARPKTPPIPRELVDWLDALFPPARVAPGVLPDAVMYSAGQRSVVEKLRFELDQKDAEADLHDLPA